MGQIMGIDYTNWDPSGGTTKRRGNQPRPPRRQPKAAVPGVNAEYRGVEMPDRPPNYGAAGPESSSGWRWFWKHNGWLASICLGVVIGVAFGIAYFALSGTEVWFSLTWAVFWGMGVAWTVNLFIAIFSRNKKFPPKKGSMLYWGVVPSIYGLVMLVIFAIDAIGKIAAGL